MNVNTADQSKCSRRRGAVVKGVEDFDKLVSRHLSGAGSSPVGSISRVLNSQKSTINTLPLALWYKQPVYSFTEYCKTCSVDRTRNHPR